MTQIHKPYYAVELSQKDWDWLNDLLAVDFERAKGGNQAAVALIDKLHARKTANPYTACWTYENGTAIWFEMESTDVRYYATLYGENDSDFTRIGDWNQTLVWTVTFFGEQYECEFIIKEEK